MNNFLKVAFCGIFKCRYLTQMANMQRELMTSYWHAPLSVQCDCRLFQGFWEGKEITTSISTNARQHFDKGFFELFYCF